MRSQVIQYLPAGSLDLLVFRSVSILGCSFLFQKKTHLDNSIEIAEHIQAAWDPACNVDALLPRRKDFIAIRRPLKHLPFLPSILSMATMRVSRELTITDV